VADQYLNTPEEIWKPIPDFPGYDISDQGRVRSYKYTTGKILSPNTQRNGYCSVLLCVSGKKHRIQIHRLVLLAFVGPCPIGMEASHNDGCQANNRLENLRWDTPSNNHLDKRKHGTLLEGDKHPSSMLTSAEVREIRQLASHGITQDKISKIYGISQSNVSYIVNRQTWATQD
jgi:hypothetical protein